jgi:HEAT repeat protein
MPIGIVAVLAFAAAQVLILIVLLVRRGWLRRAQRRHAAQVKRLRPAAIVLVEGETPVPALGRRDEEVFAELLSGYARALRGESLTRIATYFEASGGVDAQLSLLRRHPAWRRATAAFRLGDMRSGRAIPALTHALDDRSRDVRMAAVRSLGFLGAVDTIEPLVAAGVSGRVPRDVVGLALFDIGPPAVDRLVELSSHPDPEMRADAITLIGVLGTAGDADTMLDHLADPSADVRASTASALGRLGAAAARDALITALDDRVPAVCASAAHALGQIGGRRAVDKLLPLARSDTYEPAREAAEAVARIDPVLVRRVASEPGASPHLQEVADVIAL